MQIAGSTTCSVSAFAISPEQGRRLLGQRRNNPRNKGSETINTRRDLDYFFQQHDIFTNHVSAIVERNQKAWSCASWVDLSKLSRLVCVLQIGLPCQGRSVPDELLCSYRHLIKKLLDEDSAFTLPPWNSVWQTVRRILLLVWHVCTSAPVKTSKLDPSASCRATIFGKKRIIYLRLVAAIHLTPQVKCQNSDRTWIYTL